MLGAGNWWDNWNCGVWCGCFILFFLNTDSILSYFKMFFVHNFIPYLCQFESQKLVPGFPPAAALSFDVLFR